MLIEDSQFDTYAFRSSGGRTIDDVCRREGA